MHRRLEVRLQRLELSAQSFLAPLTVIFVGEGQDVAKAEAARAAAPGRVMAVEFVTSRYEAEPNSRWQRVETAPRVNLPPIPAWGEGDDRRATRLISWEAEGSSFGPCSQRAFSPDGRTCGPAVARPLTDR